MISGDLTKAIIDQDYKHIQDQKFIKENKNKIKTSGEKIYADKLKTIREYLDEKSMRLNDIAQERCVSNWLTVLPIIEQNFNLNNFGTIFLCDMDGLFQIPKLPIVPVVQSSTCNSLNCKKRGFVTFRHNAVVNLRRICSKRYTKVLQQRLLYLT